MMMTAVVVVVGEDESALVWADGSVVGAEPVLDIPPVLSGRFALIS